MEKPYSGESLPVKANFEAKSQSLSFRPQSADWKAGILPLNYSRLIRRFYGMTGVKTSNISSSLVQTNTGPS
jgi:hypothetical protein